MDPLPPPVVSSAWHPDHHPTCQRLLQGPGWFQGCGFPFCKKSIGKFFSLTKSCHPSHPPNQVLYVGLAPVGLCQLGLQVGPHSWCLMLPAFWDVIIISSGPSLGFGAPRLSSCRLTISDWKMTCGCLKLETKILVGGWTNPSEKY